MSTRLHVTNLGSGAAGSVLVGVTLYNSNGSQHLARTTSGISEIGTNTGIFMKKITVEDDFDGIVLWDTGGTSPKYAVEETLGQLNSIQDETDNIRIILNTMRQQKESLNKAIEISTSIKNDKRISKESLSDIEKVINRSLGNVEKSIDGVLSNIKLPEMKIPDYSKEIIGLNKSLNDIYEEIHIILKNSKEWNREASLLPKVINLDNKLESVFINLSKKMNIIAKADEVKKLFGNLLFEMNNLLKEISNTKDKIDNVDNSISKTVKPAKLFQEIYSILEQAQDFKKMSDEYKAKVQALKMSGVI